MMKILKVTGEKDICDKRTVRLISNFSSEIMEARRQCNEILKMFGGQRKVNPDFQLQ